MCDKNYESLYKNNKQCYNFLKISHQFKIIKGGSNSLSPQTVSSLCPDTRTTISDEYQRYRTIMEILDQAIKFISSGHINLNDKEYDIIKYETKNIIERLLLGWANRATLKCFPDPILNGNEKYKEYKKELIYQRNKHRLFKYQINEIKSHVKNIKKIIKLYISKRKNKDIEREIEPRWSITTQGNLSTFTIIDPRTEKITYERSIKASRMNLLINLANGSDPEGGLSAKELVVKLLLRYACIISGPSHWEAPIEYFRILYKLGVRFESFSSPINSNFLLPEFTDTHICSLFYDTDKVFHSTGGFFQVDFLNYYSETFTPIIVVGPPYYDELIYKIAKKIVKDCTRAKNENKKIRFIVTHSNSWDYSEGFRILKTSEYCRFDHVFKRNEHAYNNDKGEQIKARFETRLFVLDHGIPIDDEYKKELVNIFPRVP